MARSVSDQAVELEVGRDPEGVRLTLSVGLLSVACVLPPAAVDELTEKMASAGESTRVNAQQARERQMAERKERRGTGAEEVLGLIRGGVLRVGEELVMRSGGDVHRAKVLADGRFAVGGHVMSTPTEAASFAAQARRSGWKIWTNTAGVPLEALRWRARARSFQTGAEGDVLMAWIEFALARRLSPGKDHSGLLAAFCSSTGTAPDLATVVLGQWLDWCQHNKWTRSG